MGNKHLSLLTIPNRHAFIDQLNDEVKRHQELSLILIDVVRFSDVSSSFGYRVGDNILLEIANRMDNLFESALVFGRLSGDIFAIVIAGRHSEQQQRNTYNYLVDHFKAPIVFDGHAFIADFNVGAVANLASNSDTLRLMSRAEAALKLAKESKYENFHALNLEVRQDTGRSLALKADLKRAFSNSELEIFFQPKIDLTSLKITGAECLLRWYHPLDGLLFPGALIEAAESYNMMNEIGYWTLERAFQHAADFKVQGLNIRLSVNMAPTQLYDSQFASRLAELSENYNIPLSQFELELTEDVALSNSLMVKRQLAALKVMGMQIAIDDFGKGYSNLAYIRDMDVDTIKIDKTFVLELENNPVNKAIIQAAKLLGDAMHCNVVAEGIETLHQLHVLREVGINYGQGYLFSRAIPADEFIQFSQTDLSVGTSLAFQKRKS